MTDIGLEGELVPLRQGDRVAKGEHISINNTVAHRNFPNADDLQQLYDDLDGVNIIPGTARSPYKYFQKLQLGTGIAQFPSGNIVLNSANNFRTTHVIVPEINTNGGIVAGVPFFSEYYGSLRVEVTTAVTLRITARFYHFSNQPNEFSNIQQVEDRFSSNRQTPVRLRGLSSPPIILNLGTLNIPGGPTFNITEEFLNTIFPFRIELEIESFDVTTGETNTGTTITDLELVEPTIVFSQLDETVLSSSSEGTFSAIRFNDDNDNNLPPIDGTTQDTFNASLTGITIKEGYAFRFRFGTVPAEGVTYTLGRFTPFSTLVAKVDNPSLNAAGDWNVLRAGTDYPVTDVEAHLLDQVTENDVTVEAADASAAGEATDVRFWLRAVAVTSGTVNNPGTGLLNAEAQDNSFTQTTSDDAKILYVELDTTYGTAQGAANLRGRVESADGEILQRLPFSTAFTRDADLSTAKSAEVYRTTAALRGNFLGYLANQIVRVFRTETQRHFKLSAQPVVNVTPNIIDVEEIDFTEDVQGKLNKPTLIVREQAVLDSFTLSGSTESADTVLPINIDMLRKFGGFSAKESDYDTVQTDDGIFGSFQGQSTQVIAIDDSIQITSFTGSVSGTGTVEELVPSLLKGKRMYRVTLPLETSTSNRYIPNGIVTSDDQYDVASRIKIGGENLDQELHDRVYAGGNSVPGLSPAMQALQANLTKVDVSATSTWTVPPNPTRTRTVSITRLFAAYFDENRRGSTPFTGNYFEDLADPTITLTTGFDVSGLPLTNNFKKIYAFSHYIVRETFTTDINLIKAGTRRIIGIDSNGLYVEQGLQDGSQVTVSLRTRLFATAAESNSIQYLRGVGQNDVSFFVPDTITFPETFTIRFKTVEGDGTVGPQTNLQYTVTDRAVSQAQNSQTVAISLPTPPGGTRDETITTEYNATTNTIIVGTTGLSQNTTQDVTHLGMEITYDDSTTANSSSTNTKVRFAQQDEHRGREINILFILQAVNPDETSADKFLEILAIVNGRQENNISLHYRETNYDFSNIQLGPDTAMENYFYADANDVDNVLFPGKQSYISDGNISISQVQYYNYDDGGIPFQAPSHDDLYRLWQRREEFLGLFVHPSASSRKFTLNGDLGLTNVDIAGTLIDADIVEDVGTTDGYRWEFKTSS